MIWWVAAALAAPVECGALEAASLLAEARIEERRAPLTHPELIPGLALASARTDDDLRTALTDLCGVADARLSLVPGESWEGSGWSAHTFLLTRSEQVGCTLFQRSIAISVGVSDATAPRYGLRTRMPVTRTPVGDCATLPTWREEEVLAGAGSAVRIVLASDIEADRRMHSEVLVRRASAEGWVEQSLMEPAPERVLSGGDGPRFDLTERFEDAWVVSHGDRRGTGEACVAIPGQTVWTWSEAQGRFVPRTGREALELLASRGLWRLAGEDGWMLLLLQEDESEAEVLAWRKIKLERRSPEPLHTFPSKWFPGLNPGFLVVAPAPWSDRASAEAARGKGRKWRASYVKRAWEAVNPCAEP